MYKLKPLSKEAITAALEKAYRYRFLNEPLEAESICLDILEVDPDNQQALVTLLLAITDQFGESLEPHFRKANDLVGRLTNEYDRCFYQGIIYERRAKAHMEAAKFGSGTIAHDYLQKAMKAYEQAMALRAPGNDDPILRWNTCARTIMREPALVPGEQNTEVELLE